jgi:hypothetical protein
MGNAPAGKQVRAMTRWTHLFSLTIALGLLAVLFPVTSALGGLGPAELTTALLITLPAAFVLMRASTLVLGLRARTRQAEA